MFLGDGDESNLLVKGPRSVLILKSLVAGSLFLEFFSISPARPCFDYSLFKHLFNLQEIFDLFSGNHLIVHAVLNLQYFTMF